VKVKQIKRVREKRSERSRFQGERVYDRMEVIRGERERKRERQIRSPTVSSAESNASQS
jgi:hypothetical protein